MTSLLLAAQHAVLARVRVEAAHREPRLAEPEPRQLTGRQPDHALDRLAREQARHGGERLVDRGQHDAQRVGVEHHRHRRRAGQVREQLGMAPPRQAREREGLLADRRRRHGVDLAGHRVPDRREDRVVRRAPGFGGDPAGLNARRVDPAVEHRRAHLGHARAGRGLGGDLGSDAGRVADRDRHAREAHRHPPVPHPPQPPVPAAPSPELPGYGSSRCAGAAAVVQLVAEAALQPAAQARQPATGSGRGPAAWPS